MTTDTVDPDNAKICARSREAEGEEQAHQESQRHQEAARGQEEQAENRARQRESRDYCAD